MTITVSHTISMGHRLPSYDGICSSMHGHNVRVVAVLRVAQFTDFKQVSDHLGIILADLDHAMVLYKHDPFVAVLSSLPQRLVLLSKDPTTEVVAQYVFNVLSDGYDVDTVTVHETDKYAATVQSSDPAVKRLV